MIDFAGALAASFVLGIIIGARIRRLPAVTYLVLLLTAVLVSYLVGSYPFYNFELGAPLNLVFITSFLGLVFGSLLLGGGSK